MLYLQALRNLSPMKRTSYVEFREKSSGLFMQIHVDAKRTLWHFFQNDQLVPYLQKNGFANVAPVEPETGFIRFHQRYLELFIIDVMCNVKGHYFQGLSQILSAFYFAFVKDCYLQKNDLFDKYISNTVVRFDNDVESITSGIDDVIEDYVTVLKAAVKLCEVSLVPLFDDDLSVLSKYVKLSFEPYMRLIDSKLY